MFHSEFARAAQPWRPDRFIGERLALQLWPGGRAFDCRHSERVRVFAQGDFDENSNLRESQLGVRYFIAAC